MFSDRRACGTGVLCITLLTLSAAGVTVPDIVAQVSEQEYRNNLDNRLYTRLGHNRGMAGAEHDLARDSIRDYFQSLGLETTLEAFSATSEWVASVNVVAAKPGLVRPEDIYIVCAHYDSYNNPGADDDASGVAAMMEIARVLAPYDFEATILFIAFDAEEVSRGGSRAYSYTHQNDNILGVLSLDMIAYNNGSNVVEVTNRVYSPLQDEMALAVLAYGQGLTPIVKVTFEGTDNDSFVYYSIEALNLIEQRPNPRYHDKTDSVDMPGYLDYAYATKITRCAAGFLAEKATLLPVPESVPPAWVGDLVGQPSATSGAVDLTWTSPADYGLDGSGPYTCDHYELRYSSNPIAYDDGGASWDAATPVTGLPKPGAPGTAESLTVTGLSANHTYYFALRAVDRFGNASEVSNCTQTTASAFGTRILQVGLDGYIGQVDSYMIADNPSNFGTEEGMTVRGFADEEPGNVQRCILRFDLAAIPSDVQLTMAKLHLYSYDPSQATGTHGMYGAYPLTRTWIDSEVSWTEAMAGEPWTTPGGDFLPQPDGTATKEKGAGRWYLFNVTARVQDWLSGTSENHGWVIRCRNESLPNQDRFHTAEAAAADLRPYLLLTDLPDPVVGDANADGLVDVVDLLTLVGSFGAYCGIDRAYDPRADFNADYIVDVIDLLILVENWPDEDGIAAADLLRLIEK